MRPTAALLTAATMLGSATAAAISASGDGGFNCDQWGKVVVGEYTVYNNLWNKSAATQGSQCFHASSLPDNAVTWKTTWTWIGGTGHVKSYANAALTSLASNPKQVAAIRSIPTTWSWTNTGAGAIADVAYDLFTSSSATGHVENEVMIWLAAPGGARPISSTYGAGGYPTPIGTAHVGGAPWTLYQGSNRELKVWSFVADRTHRSFSGDLKGFFDYLVGHGALSDRQYLVSASAGTEAFEGRDVTFTTSRYSIRVS